MKMKKIILLLMLILFSTFSFGLNTKDYENAGDIIQIALPISAATGSILYGDYEGLKQFAYSFSSTLATTYALKYSISRERPDGADDHSFPSGHTSASFSAASYIQMRYNWYLGAPAYLLASFVGYSRVRADRHYQSDVYAGAAIATAFSYLFTTKFSKKNFSITPTVSYETWGLRIAYKF